MVIASQRDAACNCGTTVKINSDADVDVLRIGPCQIPGRNHSRENARVDSDTQMLDVAAAIAAKGISRAGNVRYRTVGLAVNTRGKRDT